MTHTIEDAIEILAGIQPRIVNIRIDHNEKNLIKSIGRQVSNGLALTDRQLELALKKIQKYQVNLEKNNIDVNTLILLKSLRLPLREIDRSQTISVAIDEDNKKVLCIKGARSKNFSEKWSNIVSKIIGEIHEAGSVKTLPLNETNILAVISEMQDTDFDIDNELIEVYQKLEKILENPEKYAPYVDLVNDQVVVHNANKHCVSYIENNITVETKANFLSYIDKLKNCGIYHKNAEIIKKIEKTAPNEFTKTVLTTPATRFRIDPDQHQFNTIISVIEALDQWPVLVLVDDDHKAIQQVSTVFSALHEKIPVEDITVFFRLESGQKNHSEFNQMVKDNHLNNYIGSNTKVVFIAKNKIPKPLLKADWKPNAAVMLSSHDFGKTSAFLDDMSTVYYYNNSIVVRNNKIKGARQIAQL